VEKTKIYADAEKAVAKGQVDKALQHLEGILRADARDPKALNRAADLYFKKNEQAKAIEYLTRVGEIYTKDGFFSKAVAIYKRILKQDAAAPQDSLILIHEKLADLYSQLGLASDAANHFKVVIQYYEGSDNKKSLLRVLKKVAESDPFNVTSQVKLAELLAGEGKMDDASDCLAHVAESIQARGNPAEIVRVYEKWVEIFPEQIDKLSKLVSLYVEGHEPKKALGRIYDFFKKQPKDPEVLSLLSNTFISLNQPAKSQVVDIQIYKIYREAGNSAKVQELEDRIMSGAHAQSVLDVAAGAEEIIPTDVEGGSGDDIDSLLSKLETSPEEEKLLSECEVYIKYGLLEKAQEVLSAQLSNFPQSIYLRWKLKNIYLEADNRQAAAHLLSEIILLAQSSQQQAWVDVCAVELTDIDPNHATLQGLQTAKSAEIPSQIKEEEPPLQPEEEMLDLGGEAVDESVELHDEPAPEQPEEVAETVEAQKEEAAIDLSPELPTEENLKSSEELSDISFVDMESEPANETPAFDLSSEIKEEDPLVEKPSQDAFDLGTRIEPEAFDESAESSATLDEISQLDLNLEPEEKQEEEFSLEEPSVEQMASDKLSKIESEEVDVNEITEPEAAAEPALELEVVEDPATSIDHESFISPKLEEDSQPVEEEKQVEEASEEPLELEEIEPLEEDGVTEKVAQLEAMGEQVKVSVQAEDESQNDDYIDLAGELEEEMKGEEIAESDQMEELLGTFKEGVNQTVSEDDWQAHFDLGVAYREMGVFNEAIEEFNKVKQAEGHAASALYQIGLCQVAQGNFQEAITAFNEALNQPNLQNQEKLSVSYDLADVLLKMKDTDRAKSLLEEVLKLDENFRQAKQKLKILS
jgi:tetratricopeptide (TPR) repeat protein